MYALTWDEGDFIGWYKFSIVAVSEDKEKLEAKRLEIIENRIKKIKDNGPASFNEQTLDKMIEQEREILEKGYRIKEDIEVL